MTCGWQWERSHVLKEHSEPQPPLGLGRSDPVLRAVWLWACVLRTDASVTKVIDPVEEPLRELGICLE